VFVRVVYYDVTAVTLHAFVVCVCVCVCVRARAFVTMSLSLPCVHTCEVFRV
jgi:hypothetical protein